MKIKWFSQDTEPTKSKNIILKFDNVDSLTHCIDYTYNFSNENQELDWKSFCSHKFLLVHQKFKWAYWKDIEKELLKGIKNEN